MIEFLKENWRLILEASLVIASFVLLLCRKKSVKVVDTIKELIVRLLPALINNAEKSAFKGSDKMDLVLDSLKKVLIDFGYGDDIVSQYLPFAKEQVEVILSTPQKKGVI